MQEFWNRLLGASLIAAAFGHTVILRLLMDAKADVHVSRKIDGLTCLTCAAAEGHAEACKFLLEVKADTSPVAVAKSINNLKCDGTAFQVASFSKFAELMQLLRVG